MVKAVDLFAEEHTDHFKLFASSSHLQPHIYSIVKLNKVMLTVSLLCENGWGCGRLVWINFIYSILTYSVSTHVWIFLFVCWIYLIKRNSSNSAWCIYTIYWSCDPTVFVYDTSWCIDWWITQAGCKMCCLLQKTIFFKTLSAPKGKDIPVLYIRINSSY